MTAYAAEHGSATPLHEALRGRCTLQPDEAESKLTRYSYRKGVHALWQAATRTFGKAYAKHD